MSNTPASAAQDRRVKLAQLLAAGSLPARAGGRMAPPRDGVEAPLSFAQRRLWFLDRLVPGSPFYNVPGGISIAGELDADAAERALKAIATRHEVLRTTIHQRDGEPFQRIHDRLAIPFERLDLAALAPAARQERAAVFARDHGLRPFDLERAPGLRAAVVRLGPDESLFLICMHHIVSDGWSIGVLVREFGLFYDAFAHGRPADLPPLPIQYADFAARQRRLLADGAWQPQLDYWKRRLEALPTLELPTDFLRRPVQSFDGRTLTALIPPDLTRALHALARAERVTLFTVLLAAFTALLHRYTGRDDIVVGEPVANRNRSELEPLIGFFVNSLVLRVDLSGDPGFRELLHRCRTTVLEADANQDVPFELVVEALRPERTMGRNPLFQVSLQFFSGGEAGGIQPATGGDAVEIEKGTASLDLAFDLYEEARGIVIRAEYSTDLFTGATVERMTAHFRTLLAAFAADPSLRVSQAPMTAAEDPQRMAAAVRPRGTDVVLAHELFAGQAARAPGAVALDDGPTQLGYGALETGTRAIAAALAARGVGPEVIVALCLPRSIGFVEGLLGVWKAGGAVLPLDPAMPDARLLGLLDDARPALVIAESGRAARFGDWHGEVVDLASLRRGAPAGPVEPATASNLAYVVYTSGSTGRPKGVAVEHGALARHLAWMQSDFPLGPADRTLFKYAVTFDVALLEIMSALGAGARLHVFDGTDPVDPARLAALVRDVGLTALDVVPAHLAALVDLPAFRSARTLRRIVCGGEALPAELLRRAGERTGAEIVNMYGPTEATISATAWRAGPLRPDEAVPIGRPGAPYTAHVVDRYLNEVPPGIPGELCLGGPCIARGYLNQPELTRERFVPDPFDPAGTARLYRTGDRVRRRADGNLEFIGRIDDQVKLRGFRIEPGEIEAALSASPLVRACAVALRAAKASEPQLVAYVVPNDGEAEFWPSVGEYFVYDELLYGSMTRDAVRMRAYRAAIDAAAAGRVVVDVGTGGDLALARLCLAAGAARVYAIEMDPVACEAARRLARTIDGGDRVIVVEGDARTVSLPEPADLCVSELIGTVGSSEGVIPVLNAARRFLRPGGRMIPDGCVTRIAAVSLPPRLRASPALSDLPAHYAELVFKRFGRRFDLRLCAKNLPMAAIVSDSAVAETLRFDREQPLEESVDIGLAIRRTCTIDGFVLWVKVEPGGGTAIDALTSDTSWLPLFLPVFSPPLEVAEGDTIRAVFARIAEPGELAPDYVLKGEVVRRHGGRQAFSHDARRLAPACGATPFHRALLEPPDEGDRRRDREGVERWRGIYDRLYARPGEGSDPEFDCTGWDSSYDQAPLGELDMREQVEGTVGRVAALKPRAILEIGCGTGLLLFPLARGCERYVGTDISAAALEPLARTARLRGFHMVELLHRDALDFTGLDDGSFDVVLLNSVIQYFPSMAYLARVLAAATRVLRPGGSIFVGDVRSRPLLPLQQLDVELSQSRERIPVAELRRRLHSRAERERELVVDPSFFSAFAARTPGLAGAIVQPKRGWRDNELTLYRFDAIVRRSGPAEAPACPPPEEVDWGELGDLQGLQDRLAAGSGAAPLRITNILSRRLVRQQALLAAVELAEPGTPVADVAASLALPADVVDPEDLWALEDEFDVDVRVEWPAGGTPDRLEALISPRGCQPSPAGRATAAQDLPWFAYGNEAGATRTTPHETEQRLREHLQARLPAHMVPATFVWMDALPRTSHAKLDRAALPDPDLPPPDDALAPPATPLETEIAAVWGQVLGRERIGVEASFFSIGGHSLLAMQVVARLSERMRREVPLRLIFEHPTVRQLAAKLGSDQPAA